MKKVGRLFTLGLATTLGLGSITSTYAVVMAKTTYDTVIDNAYIFQQEGVFDIGIKEGRITSILPEIDLSQASQVIDATDKLVIPGFVDSHMHIDKAMIPGDENNTDLMSAIVASGSYIANVPTEEVYNDIIRRASEVIEMAIVNGTTAIKTNVVISEAWETVALDAMLALKEQYAPYIDIYTCVPFDSGFQEVLEEYAQRGEIDFIAGYPTLAEDYKQCVDTLFEVSLKYDIPIDIHVDESDAPNIDCFNYVLDKTIETGLQGRVTCGHVTALSADGIDESVAQAAIAKAKLAEVNITTLSSCNMYLMSMDRRGMTDVGAFLEAGVNVAYASDNVRDPFRPFGNADMLEEALITAQMNKFGTPSMLEDTLEMGTYNAAKNTMLTNYGVTVGADADLVILDATSAAEAIIEQVDKAYVLKRGTVSVVDGVKQTLVE